MKSSGTKTELICRLQSVKEEVVLEAIAEVLQGTDGPEEDADDVEQLSSKVGQLQGIVGQLSQEIGTLRTTVAENISLMMDTNEIVSSSSQSTPMITSNINTCPLASYVPTMPTITTTTQNAHQGNLYSQVNYDSLATNMYARSTFPSPAAQNVFLPSPHYMVSQQQPMVSQQQPMVSSRVYPHMVQSPAATMPSTVGHMHSVKDISSILPVFDPTDEAYTSVQFVERIEQLQHVYGWHDAVLVFAVLGKLKGVAKRWADAQPVFSKWEQFAAAFLNDFPCVGNKANAHIKLMSAKMNRNEKYVEFYYRMLAIGRRENIDDESIVRYVINGLYDENIKRTLSAMQFHSCADLLKSMINISNVCNQDVKPRVVEIAKNFNSFNDNPVIKKNNFELNKKDNNSGPICFNCRQRGHISRNCTQPRKFKPNGNVNNLRNDESDDSVIDETEVNSVVADKVKELIKKVLICSENISCHALIDSGSGKSLIKRSIAIKTKCEIMQCREKLLGFAGGRIECSEKISLIIKIDSVERQAEFIVVEDAIMSYDMLIGLDILSKGTVVIKNGACKIMAIENNPVDLGSELDGCMVRKFTELISMYKNCFGEELHELGKSKRFKMTIEVNSSKPIYKKPYNVPIPKREVVDKIVNDLLELDIVRPSTSLYASPIVLVRKQNGEDRM